MRICHVPNVHNESNVQKGGRSSQRLSGVHCHGRWSLLPTEGIKEWKANGRVDRLYGRWSSLPAALHGLSRGNARVIWVGTPVAACCFCMALHERKCNARVMFRPRSLHFVCPNEKLKYFEDQQGYLRYNQPSFGKWTNGRLGR